MSKVLEIDRLKPANLPQLCGGIFASLITATLGAFIADGVCRLTSEYPPLAFFAWYACGFAVLSLPIGYLLRRRSSPGLGMGILIGTVFIVTPVLLFLQGLVDSLQGLKF